MTIRVKAVQVSSAGGGWELVECEITLPLIMYDLIIIGPAFAGRWEFLAPGVGLIRATLRRE